jgi:hypothetical protein
VDIEDEKGKGMSRQRENEHLKVSEAISIREAALRRCSGGSETLDEILSDASPTRKRARKSQPVHQLLLRQEARKIEEFNARLHLDQQKLQYQQERLAFERKKYEEDRDRETERLNIQHQKDVALIDLIKKLAGKQ